MTNTPWVVHKFGGSSVAGADRYRRVAEIVAREPGARKGVVVSAMSGVTDKLHELVELARKRDDSGGAKLAELRKSHEETIRNLLSGAPGALSAQLLQSVLEPLEMECAQIADLLKAVWLSRSCSEQTLELVVGHGELWSARMLAAYLRSQGSDARFLDARQVLVVTQGETGPVIDWDVSTRKLTEWLEKNPTNLPIITGYVASLPDGVATTLKRNGSDFSASIFGALLDASSIVIWTDVDGVLSADPRRVPEAVVLDEMSYEEAVELTYFGAKVIHPHTMAPAMRKSIPIWIRNTFNPTYPGTRIHHSKAPAPKGNGEAPELRHAVKGFTTVDKVALVNVEGTGMIGVPGIASRLFGALREVGVSVIMISQASSEHSICFAVPEAQGQAAKEAAERAFLPEIQQNRIHSVELVSGCSILAAVGENMVEVPGVAAKFFQSLAKAGVSVRAIAQGSSERNISAVIDQIQATRGLRAAHAGFFLSPQTISVGLIGPGLIGSTLLSQLDAQSEWLRKNFKIDLRVRAIASSKKMLLAEQSVNLKSWKSELEAKGVAADLAKFTEHVHAEHIPASVVVDCSSSEAVASHYAGWLERGVHVVTPNKKANSGPLPAYRKIKSLGRHVGSHYLYEATVGAGLPVITTLRDLIQTGDRVLQIEGILSGTLSYIFNTLSGGTGSFSATVAKAKELGYTEPDPRDDLSGMDVARKLIILGREMGLELELSDIAVQSLVPKALQGAKSAAEFLAELPKFDAEMQKKLAEAIAAGEVLRYVGVVTADGKSSVELKRYPRGHAFGAISGTDNIFAFTTERYQAQPLIVRGPGAGPQVTAGGVFADLLRLAAYVGAPT